MFTPMQPAINANRSNIGTYADNITGITIAEGTVSESISDNGNLCNDMTGVVRALEKITLENIKMADAILITIEGGNNAVNVEERCAQSSILATLQQIKRANVYLNSRLDKINRKL